MMFYWEAPPDKRPPIYLLLSLHWRRTRRRVEVVHRRYHFRSCCRPRSPYGNFCCMDLAGVNGPGSLFSRRRFTGDEVGYQPGGAGVDLFPFKGDQTHALVGATFRFTGDERSLGRDRADSSSASASSSSLSLSSSLSSESSIVRCVDLRGVGSPGSLSRRRFPGDEDDDLLTFLGRGQALRVLNASKQSIGLIWGP